MKWAWTPNVDWDGRHALAPYYPGDAYVDWLGLDGYNQTWTGWNWFHHLFVRSMAELGSLNSKDPVVIAETSSSEATAAQAAVGETKAAWITDAFNHGIPSFRRIQAVVWFNQDKSREEGCACDWRIESSPAAAAAIATALAAHTHVSAP